MLESVLQNLINIGWAMLIFLAAYLANVAFSLWYNIKILHEAFDKDKLIASGLKILTFVVGLTLLCTAITTLPLSQIKSAGRFPRSILTSSLTLLSSAPCCSWPASTSRRPLLSSWQS